MRDAAVTKFWLDHGAIRQTDHSPDTFSPRAALVVTYAHHLSTTGDTPHCTRLGPPMNGGSLCTARVLRIGRTALGLVQIRASAGSRY